MAAAAEDAILATNPEVTPSIEEGAAGDATRRGSWGWRAPVAAVVAAGAALLLAAAALCGGGARQPGVEPELRPRRGLSALAPFAEGRASNRYTVMIDCGSSSSRLFVYKEEGGALVAVNDRDEDEIENRSLSSFVDSPLGAGPMIGYMLRQSLDFVPERKRASTPLYIFATAGMRLLNQSQASHVWMSVRAYLLEPRNNPYQFSPLHAKTMAGDLEGVYQYITVQNLLHNKSIALEKKPAGERLGIMEMGGASLQVAFRPTASLLLNAFDFDLYEKREQIFVTSYLGFGVNKAMLRSFYVLAGELKGKGRVDDPCLFSGSKETVNIDGRNVTFMGTSNPWACRLLVRKLLHLDYECLQQPCGIMGMYQPPPPKIGKFLALSSFFYTASNLGLVGWNENKAVPPKDIKAGARNVCQLSKKELKRTPPYNETYASFGWDHMKTLCFSSWLVTELLDAWEFAPDDTSVNYTRKFRGESLTWTRGAVLYQTQYMQWRKTG